MIINAVELKNIRSYTNERIEFSDGVTLLAGDIGSGKSTILLAIEFALFGTRRGDIQGDGILRHGEKEGSVTLTFTTEKTYTIQRSLKRGSQGVRQDTGFLAVDNTHEDLSATELKARILEILGYPEDLLTKSKGFVFRYTVYTPQEEMKQILLEPDAQRLDTLRSVFGVDRYRIIQDNASLLAKALRDDKSFLRGQIDSFSTVQEDSEAVDARIQEQKTSLLAAQKQLDNTKDFLDTLQKKGVALEEQYAQEQQRSKQRSILTAKMQQITTQLQDISKQKLVLEQRLAQTPQPMDDPSDAFDALREKETAIREKLAQITATFEFTKKQITLLEQDASSITTLDACPTCKQTVGTQHKQHVQEHAQQRIDAYLLQQAQAEQRQERAKALLEQIAEKKQSLRKRKELYGAYVQAQAAKTAAAEQLQTLEKTITALDTQYKECEQQQKALQTPLVDVAAYQEQKTLLQKAQQEFTTASVAFSRAQTLLESTQQSKAQLEKRLVLLGEHKKKLDVLSSQEQWLTKAFTPTIAIIEQHVLAAIHQEFNRLFTQWFSTLIEDDSMYAELSSSFTPLVTQNGYDADIAHLSGGEKTSVALAYRLALNSVINTLLRFLHTTDLLILDEPTDGFSSEQLDRVRAVLDELSCKQVLIVSHEQKMESYVDTVIRITKRHGISAVN